MGKILTTFNFSRQARTEKSEVWYIDMKGERIGKVHLHILSHVVGDIILTKKLQKLELEGLIAEIQYRLVFLLDPREDFIFTVYDSIEIGDYSDVIDHDELAPTRNDIQEQKKLIEKVLARHQLTRGQLNEHVICEYFKKLGYNAERASPELDALKIDIVAENNEEMIFCQAKLGKVGEKKIYSIIKHIVTLNQSSYKKKIISIVAESFPVNIEKVREQIENKHNVKVWPIYKFQILDAFPEYQRTLH